MTSLNTPKINPNDEFYTRLKDIEKEIFYYTDFFKEKIVYCNCDDYKKSNFVKFFKDNFKTLKIKKLISSGYKSKKYFVKNENFEQIKEFPVDNLMEYEFGDFRNEYCIDLLKSSDIVCTNPPFSLFREYIEQLVEYNKKFLIVGNENAISYKQIFPYFKKNIFFLGYNYINYFKVLYQEKEQYLGYGRWFTNFKVNKDFLKLTCQYNPLSCPKYDDLDAINIDKTSNIPYDYEGIMGVPISFFNKYNPKQFEIIGILSNLKKNPSFYTFGAPFVNGKKKFFRVLIKKQQIL